LEDTSQQFMQLSLQNKKVYKCIYKEIRGASGSFRETNGRPIEGVILCKYPGQSQGPV